MTNPDIHIAVVDDDESLCRSMSRLLRAANFWPTAYTSAEDFLADEGHSNYDCIVLDIQLEGMSGLELHEKLVTKGIDTPVIFITAHDAPEVRTQAESAGCAGYFRKTDSGSAVLSAIRGATSGHKS
ncbi:MAG: response regulator [Verrucomicrobiaceae bacterium]|nr:response regulator [Verrucomicrobiaceae bacterium]